MGVRLLPVTDDPAAHPRCTAGRRGRGRRSRSTSCGCATRWPCARSGSTGPSAARPGPGCSRPSPRPTPSWSARPTRSSRSTRCSPCPGVADALADRRDAVVGRLTDRRRRRAQGPGRPAPARDGHSSPRSSGWPAGTRRGSATLVIDEADAALARRSRPRGCAASSPPRSCRRGPGRRAGPGGARCRCLTAGSPGRPSAARGGLVILPVTGIGEVTPGDDLADLLAVALAPAGRRRAGARATGDVVGRHPEGRVQGRGPHRGHRRRRPGRQARRWSRRSRCGSLRRRGDLLITETRHGFVCANAGIDLSNVEVGHRRPAPRRPRPLGPPHPRRPPAPARRRGRGDRLRHVRPHLAQRGHRRGHRLRRRRRGGRPARDARRQRPRAWRPRRSASPTRSPAAAELVMGKDRGIPAAVVRGVDPRVAPAVLGGGRDRAGRRPKTSSADRPAQVTPSAAGARTPAPPGPVGQVRPRTPPELDPRPARVEAAARSSSPGRSGLCSTVGSTPAWRGHRRVELVDRGLAAGADVAAPARRPWSAARTKASTTSST